MIHSAKGLRSEEEEEEEERRLSCPTFVSYYRASRACYIYTVLRKPFTFSFFHIHGDNFVPRFFLRYSIRFDIRREEGAVKRLRGRGCFTVAAATAPALLGQV